MRNAAPRWKKFVLQLYIRFKDDDIPALSAQLTFYLLLSLFPFLLFLLNVMSFTAVTSQEFIENIAGFLPNDVSVFFQGLVSEMLGVKSATLLSISALITLWAASRGIHAISACLNKACDKDESRPFWKVSIITVFFTVCMAVLVMATLLLLILGKAIGEHIFISFHAESVFWWLWTVLRYVIPIVILFLVFLLLYKYIPNCQLKIKDALPGALFSTLGWILTSLVFSFYIDNFAGYTRIYGSIGAVIILMIWLYISSIVLLMGGELNATRSYFKCGLNIEKYEKAGITLPFPFNRKKKKTGKPQ